MVNKAVVIMRGIPGSGKSRFIELIWELMVASPDGMSVASADYFWRHNTFDVKRMAEAHAYCREQFRHFLLNGIKLIFVDNTNIKKKDYIYYVDAAKACGYQVIEAHTTERDVEVCYKRNRHNVPREVIKRYADTFER